MAGTTAHNLDATDWAILAELQRDGRLPLPELGRKVGLDESAVDDRVRRLVAAGAITGYRAAVDLPALGFPVLAWVRLVTPTPRPRPLDQLIAQRREILECMWIAADSCHLLRVAATSMHHLQDVTAALGQLGQVSASVVTETVLPIRSVCPPPRPLF